MARTYRVALAGLGRVGRALVELIGQRRDAIEKSYGLRLELVAVANSRGSLANPSGLNPREVTVEAVSRGTADLFGSGADVLVDAGPTDLERGEPGLSLILGAAERNMDLVLVNKGPLVVAFPRILGLVREKGLSIGISGAVAAALPTADTLRYALAGMEVTRMRGILNGTSNYILSRMAEGFPFGEALREARERGIAEADASLDTGGWDAAAKMLILANFLWQGSLTLKDVEVEGIESLDPGEVRGKAVKLVGRASPGAVTVRPEMLDRDDPLAAVGGTEKALEIFSPQMGRLFIAGGGSDPAAAAAAALKDIVNGALYGNPDSGSLRV